MTPFTKYFEIYRLKHCLSVIVYIAEVPRASVKIRILLYWVHMQCTYRAAPALQYYNNLLCDLWQFTSILCAFIYLSSSILCCVFSI